MGNGSGKDDREGEDLAEGLDDLLGGLKSVVRGVNRDYAANPDPHAQYLRDFSIELASILSRLEKRLEKGASPDIVQQQSLDETKALKEIIARYNQFLNGPEGQG